MKHTVVYSDANSLREKDDVAPLMTLENEDIESIDPDIATQWMNQEELMVYTFGFLDTVTLIQKAKPICKRFRKFGTKTIDLKCCCHNNNISSKKKKSFETNQELRDAVDLYAQVKRYSYGYYHNPCDPNVFEEKIVSTYGYPIDKWDVSHITDFSNTFQYCFDFNEYIGSWDVSNATVMGRMFKQAKTFNQDLSSWDVANVQVMSEMFYGATSFNNGVSCWDLSNVTTMSGMFCRAESFNQDISSWDVSNVQDMGAMFSSAKVFNQDISAWEVSNVKDMFAMFSCASSFNCNLSSWDVSNVKYMSQMFYHAKSFDQNLSSWSISNAGGMDVGAMFLGAITSKNIDKTILSFKSQLRRRTLLWRVKRCKLFPFCRP